MTNPTLCLGTEVAGCASFGGFGRLPLNLQLSTSKVYGAGAVQAPAWRRDYGLLRGGKSERGRRWRP